VVVAARGGPVEHNRFEIFSGGFVEPANDFDQFFIAR
jgi:hypothetical protein